MFGIDISEESLRAANDFNREFIEDGRVVLCLGNVADIKFEDNFFDLAVAVQNHIYWSRLEAGLSECYRVLKKDRIFLIIYEVDKIDYHLPKYKDTAIFSDLLYKTGFNSVEIIREGNHIAFISVK
ncbi:class I SAM-dependent methyltransferase [endosymbiont 'TC1' of Trimyema compressum]|uniref:class I SAM-dependent methyltransferase n=1 Tax=endosymbiont 'TC1' of Trimyema compressum TaxID=243899 RepID=UPI000B4D53D7